MVGRELALEVKVVNGIVVLEAKVVTTEDGRVVNVIVALEAKVMTAEDGRAAYSNEKFREFQEELRENEAANTVGSFPNDYQNLLPTRVDATPV
ncbi:hypothetical protein E2562_008093 [Oryza meyeriana var. granulata]|uniref:Uncharacterized protein n=1 Tax=Oryza meyeriana var. granulata TaxID=110450 RepID=A0A6G1CE91_9ORYZ|nr:hypothetical protein E2562_008093 [Oryza meyeriana var. granulata]